MIDVPTITRIRRRARYRSHRYPGGQIALGCGLAFSLMIALSGIALGSIYSNLTRDLPALEILPNLLNPTDGVLLHPTILYDRSGLHEILRLENPSAATRQYLSLDETQPNFLPSNLISATLAIMDPTFWKNPGISFEGINQNSSPTIAQRLVSDLLLSDEQPGIRRALRERILAAQVIQKYGHEQVLTWYLNSAYFGHLAYGADAASLSYFGKPASKLNLAEAAILAAVLKTPDLNPIDAPQIAIERGQNVLHTMLSQDMITGEQAAQASQMEVNLQRSETDLEESVSSFSRIVFDQLKGEIDRARLERGGLKVITTLDYHLQTQINCVVAVQLDRIQHPVEQIDLPTNEDCQAARLLPTLPPRSDELPQNLDANIVVLDHKTGQILALTGDHNTSAGGTGLTGHTPGSLLTPFIYLSGFTQGMGPASLMWDIPSDISNLKNDDELFHGPVRLRIALANDYLIPAEHVLAQLGSDKVWRTARQMGIATGEFPSEENARSIISDGNISLLELSRAYGTLANQGSLVGVSWSPSNLSNNGQTNINTVLEVVDYQGNTWLKPGEPDVKPVISPQLAYLINHILSDETARWPSLGHPNPLEIGKPVAAKTGRTASGSDAWTVGYTPGVTVGVWIGHQDNQSAGIVTPREAAAIWHAVMKYALQDQPGISWLEPTGVNHVSVCDPSGLLPTADCATIVDEIFLAGYEPTQNDTLYRSVKINRETGQLATVFTPVEFVDERVYLIVPPEASEWARQAGLTTPPDTFDILLQKSNPSPQVQITSPEIFANLSGQVPVIGYAGGTSFDHYRLQAGRGLNPSHWIPLTENIESPVNNGELGLWDTSGLNGIYALQLQVVTEDNHIQTATIQVTIDNQKPELQVKYPTNGQEISVQEKLITLQAEVSDNIAIDRVDYFMDRQLIGTIKQAPFTLPWDGNPGTHQLRILVTDLAGNSSESTTTFTVK